MTFGGMLFLVAYVHTCYIVNEISNKTQYRADYNTILGHCLKKLSCRPEKWRKILKDLFLIEHILRTGNPRFADDLKDEIYKIKNLFNFSYYDESRSDKGETSKSKNFINFQNSSRKIKIYR